MHFKLKLINLLFLLRTQEIVVEEARVSVFDEVLGYHFVSVAALHYEAAHGHVVLR